MPYPHSKPETIADGGVHIAGLVLAVPASIFLIDRAAQSGEHMTAVLVYLGCIIFSLLASAVYNMAPSANWRPVLNRFDHAAIYFKIAGTYAPLVSIIGSHYAYIILAFVWVLAVGGAVAKLWFWQKKGRGSLALYLLMGWLSLLLIWPMWQHLPRTSFALICLGGVIYSGGAVIYSKKDMKYHTAIWHFFVLVATVCFFAAIAMAL